MQHDPDHEFRYANENLTVGYAKNKYEVEARRYGRLADHTGKKAAGAAGRPLGIQAWAMKPSE